MRRVGCAAVALNPDRSLRTGLAKPFEGKIQDVTAGEIEAAVLVLRNCISPVEIWSDSKTLVDGFAAGR
eukprot:10233385-Alexandrium_andersonii.AAC.1